MDNHHLEEGISGVDPLGHDGLEEVLSGEGAVLLGELESDGVEHLVGGFHVSFHHSVGQLDDGFHDEGHEGTFHLLASSAEGLLTPALAFSVKVVVTPKALLQLGGLNLELSSVDVGESGAGEGPAFLSGTEGD